MGRSNDGGRGGEPLPAFPHFHVLLTDRLNHARGLLGQSAHGGASGGGQVRIEHPVIPARPVTCSRRAARRFVVELCEDVRIDTIQLMNFEFFNGVFREFTVSVAKTKLRLMRRDGLSLGRTSGKTCVGSR